MLFISFKIIYSIIFHSIQLVVRLPNETEETDLPGYILFLLSYKPVGGDGRYCIYFIICIDTNTF